MIINKPKFWDKKKGFLSTILYPFSFLFFIFSKLRKLIVKPIYFNIPVICVGNIYIGGTGKTPFSIFLAQELKKLGKKAVIVRKYYKNHFDEHNLIKEANPDFILCKNRVIGIREAESKKYDVVILDDGFQDIKIKKDLNIICFNEKQQVGNGMLIPSGPLRENLSSLINADIIIINGKKNSIFEKKIFNENKDLKIFYSSYKPLNKDHFENSEIFALAGIGNPENFFQLLRDSGLLIKKELKFPDHYNFSKNELKGIIDEAHRKNYQILMTEKDFYRINNLNLKEIKYLKISLEINNKDKLIEIINNSYDKKN